MPVVARGAATCFSLPVGSVDVAAPGAGDVARGAPNPPAGEWLPGSKPRSTDRLWVAGPDRLG